MKITKKKLKELLEYYTEDDIEYLVIKDALEYGSPEIFFEDLFNSGCQSGMIPYLIYYTDTHAFFDKYYDQIEEVRANYEDNIGENLRIEGDFKNFMAWFAYEEVANNIYDKLVEGL